MFLLSRNNDFIKNTKGPRNADQQIVLIPTTFKEDFLVRFSLQTVVCSAVKMKRSTTCCFTKKHRHRQATRTWWHVNFQKSRTRHFFFTKVNMCAYYDMWNITFKQRKTILQFMKKIIDKTTNVTKYSSPNKLVTSLTQENYKVESNKPSTYFPHSTRKNRLVADRGFESCVVQLWRQCGQKPRFLKYMG